MRYLWILIASLVLASCAGTPPATQTGAKACPYAGRCVECQKDPARCASGGCGECSRAEEKKAPESKGGC